jgi:quinol monooxygenase YgiN
MIKVIAKHFIEEDKIREFLESASELVETSRKENGCVSYELYQDINDPGVVTLIEEWKNKTALNEHINSGPFKKIVPELTRFSRKKGVINVYKKIL